MDSIQEYREVNVYKDFSNYQNYYDDANQQNKALQLDAKASGIKHTNSS